MMHKIKNTYIFIDKINKTQTGIMFEAESKIVWPNGLRTITLNNITTKQAIEIATKYIKENNHAKI